MPRPTKWTPEVQARIVQAIELSATYELAANYGGISYHLFNEWMKTKPTFHQAIKDAEGKSAILCLAKIEKAASDGNWQAAAWKLERRYPQMYGRRVEDITVNLRQVASETAARYGLNDEETEQLYTSVAGSIGAGKGRSPKPTE